MTSGIIFKCILCQVEHTFEGYQNHKDAVDNCRLFQLSVVEFVEEELYVNLATVFKCKSRQVNVVFHDTLSIFGDLLSFVVLLIRTVHEEHCNSILHIMYAGVRCLVCFVCSVPRGTLKEIEVSDVL